MTVQRPGSRGARVRTAPRLASALIIGTLAAVASYAYVAFHDGGYHPSDFEFWWRGTRLWASGVNPYALRPGMPAWPLADPMLYPLPALLLTWPLHRLLLPVAAGLFTGISSGWLAWVVTRDGLWRLWMFASAGFLLAMRFGQWSPLLTAAALVPSAGFILTAKPTLGLACFAYRPTWRAVWSGVAMIVVSLVVWPRWPIEWLATLGAVVGHRPPVLEPFGFVLLLAVLRWRTPEARLLLAMACVPQLMFFYDQLPLGLTARTEREAMALSASGFLALLVWTLLARRLPDYVAAATPYVMAGCYLPALVIVLRRPNEGAVPAWFGRLAAWRARERSVAGGDATSQR